MQINSNSVFLLFFFISLGGLLIYFFSDSKKNETTLELVHVIFRHGNKNPEAHTLYPSCPYLDEKYYPTGYGQLTDEGRKNLYNLGIQLRHRYNDFLGNTWNFKHLEARSSDFDRTKMSLLLVLTGLYPVQKSSPWSPNYYWQPIPYNYVPRLRDKELWPMQACPNYYKLANETYKTPKISKILQRYNETLEILGKHVGRKMDITRGYLQFLGLTVLDEQGFPLEEWTKAVYPEPLLSLTMDMIHIVTNNTATKRIISGYILKKILGDTKAKIEGNLKPPERKMFLYSGHELNIAALLLSLKAVNLDHLPPYGSYLLFEIHRINKAYGIKLFYQNLKQDNPIPLKIYGCDYFCPYDKVYTLVEEMLPNSDEECSGSPKNL